MYISTVEQCSYMNYFFQFGAKLSQNSDRHVANSIIQILCPSLRDEVFQLKTTVFSGGVGHLVKNKQG